METLENFKFGQYDHVMIIENLSPCMSRFPRNREAIIMNKPDYETGKNDSNALTLFVRYKGEISWYAPNDVKLLARDCESLLMRWGIEIDQIYEEAIALPANDLMLYEYGPGDNDFILGYTTKLFYDKNAQKNMRLLYAADDPKKWFVMYPERPDAKLTLIEECI